MYILLSMPHIKTSIQAILVLIVIANFLLMIVILHNTFWAKTI